MTLADFKKARLLQLGEAPALLAVGEHGEYIDGTIGDSKEEIQLATYGRKFSITRQALVNDDTDAFSRVPMAFGRQARNKESDLVWARNHQQRRDGQRQHRAVPRVTQQPLRHQRRDLGRVDRRRPDRDASADRHRRRLADERRAEGPHRVRRRRKRSPISS
jgi:hypothetical protein